MNQRTKRLYKLAETILLKRGITSRAQIEGMFDKGGVKGLDGVGPVLTRLIEEALQLSDAAWAVVMPRIATSAPVEGSTTYNPMRVTWYPSSEPDAPMGTVIEGHSLEPPDSTEHDPDQAYFWTPEWQAAEKEADEDIAAGRVKEFATGEEFIASLGKDDGEVVGKGPWYDPD